MIPIHSVAEVAIVDFDTLEPITPPVWRCAWPCGKEFPDEKSAATHMDEANAHRTPSGA